MGNSNNTDGNFSETLFFNRTLTLTHLMKEITIKFTSIICLFSGWLWIGTVVGDSNDTGGGNSSGTLFFNRPLLLTQLMNVITTRGS